MANVTFHLHSADRWQGNNTISVRFPQAEYSDMVPCIEHCWNFLCCCLPSIAHHSAVVRRKECRHILFGNGKSGQGFLIFKNIEHCKKDTICTTKTVADLSAQQPPFFCVSLACAHFLTFFSALLLKWRNERGNEKTNLHKVHNKHNLFHLCSCVLVPLSLSLSSVSINTVHYLQALLATPW